MWTTPRQITNTTPPIEESCHLAGYTSPTEWAEVWRAWRPREELDVEEFLVRENHARQVQRLHTSNSSNTSSDDRSSCNNAGAAEAVTQNRQKTTTTQDKEEMTTTETTEDHGEEKRRGEERRGEERRGREQVRGSEDERGKRKWNR